MNIAPVLAQQLLLVDEVMRAGKNMKAQKELDQEWLYFYIYISLYIHL